MEQELEQVQENLVSTQAQLNERSMPVNSQEQKKLIEKERAQRFKLLDELQKVNKKNAILKKQLANSVASVANPGANYRLHRIRPKKQLTETNFLAFAPWK